MQAHVEPSRFEQTELYQQGLNGEQESVANAVAAKLAAFDLIYQESLGDELTDETFTDSSPWAAHLGGVTSAETVQLSDSQPHQQTYDESVRSAKTSYANTLAEETAVHGQAVEDAAVAEDDGGDDDNGDDTTGDDEPAVTIDDAPDASVMTETATLSGIIGYGLTTAMAVLKNSVSREKGEAGPFVFTPLNDSAGKAGWQAGRLASQFSYTSGFLFDSENEHFSSDASELTTDSLAGWPDRLVGWVALATG